MIDSNNILHEAKKLINKGEANKALSLLNRNNHSNHEHFNLVGVCKAILGDIPAALGEFEKAVRLKPDYPDTYCNIGIVLSQVNERAEAIEYFKYALSLDPNNIETIYNLAVAYKELGKLELALEAYNKCIDLDKNYAAAYLNKSLIELTFGDYKNGWENYEWGFKTGNRVDRKLPGNRWQGENLQGKRIYVYSNQGYGDTIQFLRYLPLILKQDAHVIFECQPKLIPLLEPLNYWSEIVPTRKDLSVETDYDYHIPLLSLPLVFKTTLDSIPKQENIITPTDQSINKWESIFKVTEKKKVGIVWQGNPNHSNDKNRSCPFGQVKKLFELNNIQWYNLQININDVIVREEFFKNNVIDYTDHIVDFNDTAALIKNLDLIITVDTSVAHLAAAMNKETWIMVPYVPDWRWMLNREDNLWYPTVKIFRQSELNNWDSVISMIKNSLSKL